MRERVAEWLHRAGALQAVMELRRHAPVPIVSILTYHHISDHDPSYLYDPNVADATPAQFRRQMEMVARYGTPIGIDDLVRALAGAPLPNNPVMVTFDDGYLSCHDVALPILRAVGVRATFFIATSFVTERRLYWWERIALALHDARRTHATITYPRRIEIDPRDPRSRQILNDLIKRTWALDVERFLDELCRALDVAWSPAIEAEHADRLIMTCDQVRALADAGMSVQSHTRNHRVLDTLPDAALRDELLGARLDLEREIGRPVEAIAYPVGRRVQQPRVRAAIAEAGYRVGFANVGGVNPLWPPALHSALAFDPFDLRRIATECSMSEAMLLTQLAIPALGY